MTLLTFVTRTYKRPKALAKCIHSLAGDYQHLIIRDEIGIGIAETYRLMRHRDWSDVVGEYVHILDDDCLLLPGAISAFGLFLEDHDLIFAKADIAQRGILPKVWGVRPTRGQIDLGCVIMKRSLFLEAVKHCGVDYAGDFDYIDAGYEAASEIGWWDFLFTKAQRISWGKPE